MLARGSLRSTLTGVAVIAAVLAAFSTAAVFVLSTLLHRGTVSLQTAGQSIYLAEEAEIALLLHAGATSPAVRAELASEIQRLLNQSRLYVANESEQAVLDEAVGQVTAYLEAAARTDASNVSDLHAAASAALEELVNLNVAQATADAASATQIDQLADAGSVVLGLVIVSLTGGFVYWIWKVAFRGVRGLVEAMQRFGRGDLSVRANIDGPREFREMAERFNVMAEEIERHVREEQSRLNQERELGRIDALTRVPNRRAFQERAESLLAMARRFARPLTLAYIDLDNFKVVNDRYGHRAGDSALSEIAAVLRRYTRESDLLARLGGDEFVLFLPETGAALAQRSLEHLRDRVEKAMRSRGWPITVSIGALSFPEAPATLAEAVHQADLLMYRAKQAGKNRVHVEVAGAVSARPAATS